MSEEKDILESQSSIELFRGEISADRAQNIKGVAKRFLGGLVKQRAKILTVVLYIIAAAVFNIITPALIGQAINQIYDSIKNAISQGTALQVNVSTVGRIIWVIAVLYLFSALFSFLEQYIMANISQDISLSTRRSINEKLNRLPLRYYDARRRGDILSRVTSDLGKMAGALQEDLNQLITSVTAIAEAFIMMMVISPSLTMIALDSIVVSVITTALISLKTDRYYAADRAALGKLSASIGEAFTGNAIIKAFSLWDEMIETNDEPNDKLQKEFTKTQFITYVITPLVHFLGQAGYVITAVRGAVSVISGTITIDEIQAAFQYIGQITEPVIQLSYIINRLQGAIASAERVYQVQDELEEIPNITKEQLLPQPRGNVSFEHVRLGYHRGRILMEDISTSVQAGSRVATMGPAETGRTTLVNLLVRLHELRGGKITVDDVNINEMSHRELRSILGMVLQNAWLFNGTIAEDITCGRSGAAGPEIRQTAETARIDHFIRTLPQGYQTMVDGGLLDMSVGRKQLLTTARAILADPSVLILDEATSNVDTRTEIKIQKAMGNLMKGRTSFVIAHRLSTIRDADLALVVREGTIIEHGIHDGLIRQRGFYADLYNSQFTAKVS